MSSQERAPVSVVHSLLGFVMHCAFQLYDESRGRAVEVRDEPVDRMLAAEVQTVQGTAAEMSP